jgi:hypothetical protein
MPNPADRVETRDLGIVRAVQGQESALEVRMAGDSFNEANRTVDLVWSTPGSRVLRRDWWEGVKFWEELSLDPAHVRLDRLRNSAPFLPNHDAYDWRAQLGVVEAASIRNGQGVATIRIAKTEDGDALIARLRDRMPPKISIGYRIYTFEKTVPTDGSIQVWRAVDWEPFEISAVAIPADDGAGFRSNPRSETNPVRIITRDAQTERTMPEADTNAPGAQNAAPAQPAQTPAATPAAAANVQSDGARAAAHAEAVARIAEIRRLARGAGLSETFTDDLAAKPVTLDQARAAILEELARNDAQNTTRNSGVRVTRDGSDKVREGVTNWLILRDANAANTMLQAYDQARHNKDRFKIGDPGEFRGMRLIDLARMSAEAAGVRTMGRPEHLWLNDMFRTFSGPGQTTSDFPVYLENVLYKTMLARYATEPDTWSQFCKVGSVTDFREVNRYRRGSFGRLDGLTEAGEFKNKAIPDGERQKIKATTKGNIIALTRETIINDDMDAFTGLAQDLGRAAKLSIELDVFDLFALNTAAGPTMNDTNPMFHASHNNIAATVALPTVASFDAAKILMSQQKDPSGNEILALRPAIWLGPIGLESAAKVVNNSTYDPDANNKLQRPNVALGLVKTIIGTARLSGTRWYMFADPAVAAAFEVVFLNGVQEPVLEQKDGWRTDGTEWRVRLDYGVGPHDWRPAVTNAGS